MTVLRKSSKNFPAHTPGLPQCVRRGVLKHMAGAEQSRPHSFSPKNLLPEPSSVESKEKPPQFTCLSFSNLENPIKPSAQ